MYWATGILGLILVIAPFMFGFHDNTAALWTSFFVGTATIVVSLIEALQSNRKQWEYWLAVLFGIVAIVAPFLFGFVNSTSAMLSTMIVGMLIALSAGSKLMTTGTRNY